MADPRLERIRQMMKEEADKKSGTNRPTSSGDNASYPFWNIPEDSTATLRFLPDKDASNPWYWMERAVIKLPFSGTVGGDNPTDKDIEVTVPCIDMFVEFKDKCPIIEYTKPWWKKIDGQKNPKEDLARMYYKKRTFIAQGFVVHSPFEEPSVPENPIRRFTLGSEIIQKLRAGMADPDMEYMPTDYMNGYDFRIRKTKKGEHNNYSTSDWARRSRPLSEEEAMAIEKHDLFNLADFRGARPSAEGVAVIKAMFEASLAGDPYDFASWGNFFRPYGSSNANSTVASETQTHTHTDDVAPDEVVAIVETPVVETKKVETKPVTNDILARLREKNAASRG